MHLLDFAKEGNADETYAKIADMIFEAGLEPTAHVPDELIQAAMDYENAEIEDEEFCKKVVKIIEE